MEDYMKSYGAYECVNSPTPMTLSDHCLKPFEIPYFGKYRTY